MAGIIIQEAITQFYIHDMNYTLASSTRAALSLCP